MFAKSFSFKPPIGNTKPLNVTSRSGNFLINWDFCYNETIDVTIAIPADGPSFGVAPSGHVYENLFCQK